MLDENLKYWIAESESWQSFVDFNIPDDVRADYHFIKEPDDFYTSLMSEALDLFEKDDYLECEDELLAIAKGLEIYSLPNKRIYFKGTDYADNLLYVAGLYHLAGYAASAFILAKILPLVNYKSEIDLFISSFLRRMFLTDNRYSKLLEIYLNNGDKECLNDLVSEIKENKEKAFNEDFNVYASFKLAGALVRKFEYDNLWNDLLVYNNHRHWQDCVAQNMRKKIPIWSFFPSQKEALTKGILEEGQSCSLQMPTSSGKTAISELVIYDEFKKSHSCKILYLAPFRALASELKLSIARNLSNLGVSSKTIYGGNSPTLEEKNAISEVNLLIATPEKFMAIEVVLPEIFDDFTTIICDEGHLLDDETRGFSYELLLSRLKATKVKNRRFIFISAIIPNISTINNWLGGDDNSMMSSNYRPTQLEFAFLKEMTGRLKAYYLDVNPTKDRPGNYQLYKYLSNDEVKIRNKDTGGMNLNTSKKGISIAVALKAVNSGSVALFAPHKRGASGVEGLAEEAILQLTYRENITTPEEVANKEQIVSLKEYFNIIFGEEYLLTRIVDYGILFHHGDLPQGVREIVEEALREENIKMVICTNTLAEGVNLPIRTMVLHSTKRFNPSQSRLETLKIRDLKNLVGRAGRAGVETKGMVIVPHESDFRIIMNVINEQHIEDVNGRLYTITRRITEVLKKERMELSNEILDAHNEAFKQLLDSIETSIIDLIAEEVTIEELEEMVKNLIQETLTYYQSNEEEKQTLINLVTLRSEKLIPYIENNEFGVLKRSGSNIRLYDDIRDVFDFESPVWDAEIDTFDNDWVCYILDEGVFKLSRMKYELEQFNNTNGAELTFEKLRQGIELWMKEKWYDQIAFELKIEIFQVLRLLNSIIGFNISNILSTVIRLKELMSDQFVATASIANWPSYIQHGLNSQLQLDIVGLGLIERLSVIELSRFLTKQKYHHLDYKGLKTYLIGNSDFILDGLSDLLPRISFNKIKSLFEILSYKYVY